MASRRALVPNPAQERPVPELQRAKVLEGLRRLAERVPPRLRPQLSYATREQGTTFTLVERRPGNRHPGDMIELELAKLCYHAGSGRWTLLWPDRNSRWHTYEGFEDGKQVEELIREIEADPNSLFFR